MKFTEAREKFLRAVGGVEAFGLDVDSKDVEELDAIIGELIAWFDRRYPRKETPEVRTCERCGDSIPDGGIPNLLFDCCVCRSCAMKKRSKVRTCASCGDKLGRYDFPSERYDGRICHPCAARE